MAQTNYTPISLYYSTTASAVPTAANLVQGELAINTADGKLYYEDSSGVVQVLATKSTGSIGGSNTQVQFNNSGSLGGSSGLTWDGSFLTTSSIKNSALTSGRVTYAGASGLLSDSATLTYDGTSLTTPRLVLGGTTLPSAGTATLFSRTSDNNTYLQTGSGNNFNLLDGSQNTMATFSPTALNFNISNTERMRLNSTGLGIGTSSPSCLLEVNQAATSFPGFKISGSSSPGMQIVDTSGVTAHFANDSAATYFGTTTSHPLIFRTVNTERMRIDSSGNLLVGTTSGVTNGGFSFEPNYNGGGVSSAFFGHSSSGGNGNQYCVFAYNGTFIGSITQSGTTAVLYNTSSDARLKTNIVDAPSGNINSIKVRSFDWIADGSHQEYGMVAQELIEVAPYAVSKPENPDEMMGVDYSKLVPMMIKEIQDLKAEVNQLKTKIGV